MKKIHGSKIIVVLFFAVAFVVIARIFHWIPPMETIPVYFDVYKTKYYSKNDSLYVVGLHKLLDIYTNHSGYKENESYIKLDIYNYYIQRGDVKSIDFACAKLDYKLGCHEYNEEYNDAVDILLTAWREKQLKDSHLRLLYNALLLKFESTPDELSDELPITIINVVESMSLQTRTDKTRRNAMLIVMIVRSMKDISKWTDAGMYINLIDFNTIKDDETYPIYLYLKVIYYLAIHDSDRAQYYLNELKDIAPHNLEYSVKVAELQYQLCELRGDVSGANESLDNLIALSYGRDMKLNKTLLKMNYYSMKGNDFLFNLYNAFFCARLNSFYEQYKENIDEKDVRRYNRIFYKFKVEYLLIIINHYIRNGNYEIALSSLKLLQSQRLNTLTPRLRYECIKSEVDVAINISSDSVSIALRPIVEELRERVKWSVPGLSDMEKTVFWEQEESLFRKIYSINDVDSIPGMKYDIALMTKEILLNSSNNLNKDILESGDDKLIEKWECLKRLKLQSANWLINNDVEGTYVTQERIDSIEHDILRNCSIYKNSLQSWDIRWRDVQKNLPENATAIEYFYYSDKDGKNKYGALLLHKNDSCPKEILLFDQEDISSLNSVEMYDITHKSPAYELIWEPLEKYLHEGPVFISLDGILHNINIEALPCDSGLLLCDMYDIRRVSSTRELPYEDGFATEKYRTATLYGGISYDLSPERMKKNMSDSVPLRDSVHHVFSRGNFFRFPVQSLAEAKIEVEIIDEMLKQQGVATYILESDTASEESFKKMSGHSSNIIHLATHSFTDVPWKKTDPMRNCGIMFSGSNFAYTGHFENIPNGCEDGILNAAEISNMDLRNTKLVVMSSCESALGTIQNDGVFGLQRGFRQAGVKTLIMSLWSVDDEKAKRFMIEFYRFWLAGRSQREAFNMARNSLRTKPNTYKDWAAFIMLD